MSAFTKVVSLFRQLSAEQLYWKKSRYAGDCLVFLDPKGTFTGRYYNAKRGDQIFNGFDTRCVPNWALSNEIDYSNNLRATAQCAALAAAAFPMPQKVNDAGKFFIDKARGLFAELLQFSKPKDGPLTCKMMAAIMERARPELDRRMMGTVFEQDLNPGATPQRNAIISTFNLLQKAFASIPDPVPGAKPWSVREWAQTRRAWLYFTQTPLTEAILRPWHNMMFSLIVITLFDEGIRQDLPAVWPILEEGGNVGRIENFQMLATRGREYGICPVLTLQSPQQLDEPYGETERNAILGAFETQVYLKVGESAAAAWCVEQMAEQRIHEKSTSYSTSGFFTKPTVTVSQTERDRNLFIKPDFTDLEDMHGFLRFGTFALPIHLPFVEEIVRAKPFIQRDEGPVVLRDPAPIEVIEELYTLHGMGSSTVKKVDEDTTTVTIAMPKKAKIPNPKPKGQRQQKSKDVKRFKTELSTQEVANSAHISTDDDSGDYAESDIPSF